MPPPASHKKLTAAQKEMLKRWIAEGAEYQPHWSFIAPQRPGLPAVKNAAWVATRSTTSFWRSSKPPASSPRRKRTAARWPAA